MRKLNIILVIFICASVSSAQHILTRSTIGNGGGKMSNPDYKSGSTVGQSIINSANSENYSVWFGFWNTTRVLVDVNDNELLIPFKFELFQNFPNPFNPSTKIKYSIPELSKVRIEVFNILGERISMLVNEEQAPGFYILEFNASNLASGFYVYRIQAEDFVDVKKMIVLK